MSARVPSVVLVGADERIVLSGQDADALARAARAAAVELRLDRLVQEMGLAGCLRCGHPELYTRKDFSRPLGIAIVVGAAALAPFTWYLSLVAAALADLALYRRAGDVVACYRCQAEHRGFGPRPRHPRFDREIDERLRYGARAVMGKPMRPGGTADAPDPEH